MTYWREASTLMLAVGTCDETSSKSIRSTGHSRNENYNVLLMQRSRSSSYLPGSFVFPGGALDPVDYAVEWNELFDNISGQTLSDIARQLHIDGFRPKIIMEPRDWKLMTADVAFRICAIRETFEECGILLVTRKAPEGFDILDTPNIERSPLLQRATKKVPGNWDLIKIPDVADPAVLRSWQQQVCRNAADFLTMCRELSVVPNVWALREWANWLTPVMGKVQGPSKKPHRFSTMFYLCCVESNQLPEVAVDNFEAEGVEWGSPTGLLTTLRFTSPQCYELSRLARFQSLTDLASFARKREELGIRMSFIVFTSCSDGLVGLLPGDCSYPTKLDLEGVGELFEQQFVPVQQTVAEFCSESRPMNRLIMFDATAGSMRVVCTHLPACGHVLPATNLVNKSKI